jgi:hypothetical protein
LNVRRVNDVRLTEINTTGPLMLEPSASEVELAKEKLKNHKSPGIFKSQQNLLKQELKHFAMSSINLLFLFGIRRDCLRRGGSRILSLSVRMAIIQIVVIIGAYHFYQLRNLQTFIEYLALKVTSGCREIIRVHQGGFRCNY